MLSNEYLNNLSVSLHSSLIDFNRIFINCLPCDGCPRDVWFQIIKLVFFIIKKYRYIIHYNIMNNTYVYLHHDMGKNIHIVGLSQKLIDGEKVIVQKTT